MVRETMNIGRALVDQKMVKGRDSLNHGEKDGIRTSSSKKIEAKGGLRQSKNSKIVASHNQFQQNNLSTNMQVGEKRFQKLGKMLMNVNRAASTFESNDYYGNNLANQGIGILPRYNVPVRLDFETRKEKEQRVALTKGDRKDKKNIHDYVKKDCSDLNHTVKMMAYYVRENFYFKYWVVFGWIFGHLGFWASGHLDIWTFGHLGIWAFGHLCSWASGLLVFWASGRTSIQDHPVFWF